MHWIEYVYLGWCGLLSCVSLVRYGMDKRRAIRADPRRLSERSLHLVDLLGGYPGGLVGRRLFRHKTRKIGYQLIAWLIIAAHLAIIALWRAR